MSGAHIRIAEDAFGRLHLRWWADDSVLWHEILDSFKARFPTHGDRSFSSRSKTWSVLQRHYTRLCEWVDYWFEPEDQQWGEDEPDGHSYGSRSHTGSSGYGRYRRAEGGVTAIEAAYALLCVTADAPDGLVDATYRWWSRQTHPDLGGDGTLMTRVNEAVATIRAHRQRRAS
jgi:hypothetical protein